MATLTSEYQQILTSQTIDTDGPGSILRDFEMLLEWIGPEGTTVSHKNNLLPMKSLEQLNARMTHPLQLALNRRDTHICDGTVATAPSRICGNWSRIDRRLLARSDVSFLRSQIVAQCLHNRIDII